MNDRMDALLARLPQEAAPTDLSAQIILAVAVRRRARQVWQRVALAAGAGGLAGVALLSFSWAEAARLGTSLWTSVDTNVMVATLTALLLDPWNTVLRIVNAGLAWQASAADAAGVALLVGTALLAAAAFGGLARLLQAGAPVSDGQVSQIA